MVNVAADVLHPRIATVCTEPVPLPGWRPSTCWPVVVAGSCTWDSADRSARGTAPMRFAACWPDTGCRWRSTISLPSWKRAEDAPDLSTDARAMAPLLQASPQPLGVLALGDPFARAVWRICDDLGLEVPRQVAIVGMNDLPYGICPEADAHQYPAIRASKSAVGQRNCC